MSNGKKAVVIYHANCNDGFGAAWAFHIAESEKYDSVDYIPMEYNTAPDWNRLEKADHCFIVDFSFPKLTLVQISYLFEKTVVLDHHKTAQEDLDELIKNPVKNLFIVFDMSRSGAVITWDYFSTDPEPRPKILQYVQDRDLWKHFLPDTKEINALISTTSKDFDSWTHLDWDLNNKQDVCVEKGEAILLKITQLNESFASLARPCKFIIGETTYEGLVANCPGEFASDVGNILATRSGTFGATYFTDSKDQTKWSLRSNGDYDVSAIAKSFGGGGHKNACGFVIRQPDYTESGVTLWTAGKE